MSLLRYTGHPFVDVGVATITVMSRKRTPDEVSMDNLEDVAEQLSRMYCGPKKFRNHLSTIFLNSPFVQASMKQADRQEYAEHILFGFRADRALADGVQCVYFPERPAITFAHRQHVPLLNGQDIRNFSAYGQSGIPVSGLALLAIHAMPLGCIKCAGQLLAFHQIQTLQKNNADMMLYLASVAYRENTKAIQMMTINPDTEMPSRGGFQGTRYVVALLDARRQLMRRRSESMQNITGYFFTNYGPDPKLNLVRLDNNVATFVDEVEQDVGEAWRRVTQSGWAAPKRKQEQVSEEEQKRSWRNAVYEDLFKLPENSRTFLKRHLAKVHDWRLIELFLRKVMQMEPERIDTYRRLGDRLIAYMDEFEGDSLSFYYEFSRASNYSVLRRTLRRAAEQMIKAAEPEPLFTYDEFIFAFEDPSGGYSQWRLGRDLIAIRMLEQLQKRNVDLSTLPNDEVEDDESND